MQCVNEGDFVLLKASNGHQIFAQASRKGYVVIGMYNGMERRRTSYHSLLRTVQLKRKTKTPLNAIIGVPYGTVFEIEKNSLKRVDGDLLASQGILEG